jgi:murein DD-endopeptidase MepM/ murein hydrolase activator NlpD
MAQLQLFAAEVSLAYGINRTLPPQDGVSPQVGQVKLMPTLAETLAQYNHLKTASLGGSSRLSTKRWLTNTMPGVWPMVGRLLSHFGRREDPFGGHQAFHAGVDISGPIGAPIRTTADGLVAFAGWESGYGRLIVVDHLNGLSTYYAHLSRIDVIPGQEVRIGQVIGGCGASGRVTSPHLHYEVRRGGAPVNPYPYLAKSAVAVANNKRDTLFGF